MAKLGEDFRTIRIPQKRSTQPDEWPHIPVVNEPFVLITPTYGGGVELEGVKTQTVPYQVKKFLAEGDNSSYMLGVIAGGAINFGHHYGRAGDLISSRFGVPMLYRFELKGTDFDVTTCREGLLSLLHKHNLHPGVNVIVDKTGSHDRQ